MSHDSKNLHQRGVQLAIKMGDLTLAISHLKESLRLGFSEAEDHFLAELVLQKGLLDIQIGGNSLISTHLKLRGDFSNYPQKFYEAVAYLQGDRKREALEALDDILQKKPDNIEAFILKGT